MPEDSHEELPPEECEEEEQQEEEFSEEESIDLEEIDGMHDMGDDGMDISNFLVTEDGETVANSLSDINEGLQQLVHQLATTNKILIKMLSKLS